MRLMDIPLRSNDFVSNIFLIFVLCVIIADYVSKASITI